MTKRDYIQIAAVINDAAEDFPAGEDALNQVVLELLPILEADNPRFDRVRFIRACGPIARRFGL